MSEEEKAERQRTIVGNKAWKVARTVREEFISKLCQGKTLPDSSRRFALRTVMNAPYHFAKWCGQHEGEITEVVARYLGVPDPNADTEARYSRTGGPFDELVERHAKTKGWHQVLAQAAAAFEHSMREPKAWQALDRHQAGWLLHLEAEGYRLAEVEAEAVARHRPEPASESQ